MKRTMIALASLLIAHTATADGFMPWSDVMRMYDDNNDGMVSGAEVSAMAHVLGKGFVGFQPWFTDHQAALDTNKDGMVSMDEAKAWMASHEVSEDDMSKGFYKGFGFMPNNHN